MANVEHDLPRAAGKSRDWCFTLNNPDEKWEFPDCGAKYYIFQREIGASGTKHIQGFIQFENPRALGPLKTKFPRAHFESRRGTPEQARDYCRKNDSREKDCTPVEWGVFKGTKSGGGKRTDIEAFQEAVQEGASWDDLVENHGMFIAKYPGYVGIYRGKHAKRTKLVGDLRPWQNWLKELVDKEADTRSIFWFYDEAGGNGKSWMTKWLRQERNAFSSTGGKKADVAYAYNYEKIIIFDFARRQKEFVNYEVMEDLKNGRITSGKYQSVTKEFDHPHVLVFANFKPDMSAWTKDRYHIIHFKEDAGIWWQKPNTPIEERIE